MNYNIECITATTPTLVNSSQCANGYPDVSPVSDESRISVPDTPSALCHHLLHCSRFPKDEDRGQEGSIG